MRKERERLQLYLLWLYLLWLYLLWQDPAVRKERERLDRIKIKAEEEADRVWREQRRKEYESLGDDERWDAAQTAAPSPARQHAHTPITLTLTLTLTLTQAQADGRQAGDRDEKGEAGHAHRQDRLQGQQAVGRKRAQAASAPIRRLRTSRRLRIHPVQCVGMCTLRRPDSRWLVAHTGRQEHQKQEERAGALIAETRGFLESDETCWTTSGAAATLRSGRGCLVAACVRHAFVFLTSNVAGALCAQFRGWLRSSHGNHVIKVVLPEK